MKGDWNLGAVAEMCVEANVLSSAVSLVYDALYDRCDSDEIINRAPQNPIPLAPRSEIAKLLEPKRKKGGGG